MFKKGDYVVCGNNGICKVENVTTLNMAILHFKAGIHRSKHRIYSGR